MSHIIAVDIGGTHIRVALYGPEGTQPVRHRRVETQTYRGRLFEGLAAQIKSLWPAEEEVVAIGVASPGPLDPETGIILSTPNIPEWVDFPLGPKLAERFGVPVHVDNDANLAALGEWRFGAGRGHEHLVYLTISTGIGGGVISHGRLLHGAQGLGGELGHVPILPDGPLCSCGRPGHLEALASGPAIVRYVQERMASGAETALKSTMRVDARAVADAARKGDTLAREAFARAGKYLGLAVAGFLHIFNPSILILGGGVAQSGDLLLGPLQESLQTQLLNPAYLHHLTITTASLGDDAGLLGALALARLKRP
ncbi:MAG: ROK family protein [Anaerolineae bacterium]|nr:MAG: ROK family protein [Anaerolineae bacterium]